MKIWVVRTGEPVPRPGAKVRLARSGMVASRLAARGHEVTWWTGTFEHGSKSHVLPPDRPVQIGPGLEVRALHAPGYRRHASVRRLLHHWWLGRALKRAIRNIPPPDLIFASLPTIEFAAISAAYGKAHQLPVVIDCRDMWPDIFVERAPGGLRWLARAALAPLEWKVKSACRNATAIFGHTEAFVHWGIAKADRRPTQWDRVFPLAYSAVPPAATDLAAATAWWGARGVRKESGRLMACFVGSLTRHFELDRIAEAVEALRAHGDPIQIVVCGAGDREPDLRRAVEGDGRLVLAGWVDAPKIWALLQMADVGLAPYRSSPSFVQSIPNKPIEYLCAGLPVVSSLQGVLADLLLTSGAGITYPNDDPGALVAALRLLASNGEERRRMGKAARDLYAARFSADQVYGSLCESLEGIAGQSRDKLR